MLPLDVQALAGASQQYKVQQSRSSDERRRQKHQHQQQSGAEEAKGHNIGNQVPLLPVMSASKTANSHTSKGTNITEHTTVAGLAGVSGLTGHILPHSGRAGSLSSNYLYLLVWSMWKAYSYLLLARLLYNLSIYLLLLTQFFLSIHLYTFTGIFAFCNFTIFKILVVDVPNTAISQTFTYSILNKAMINDFTSARALLILYLMVSTCHLPFLLLFIAPFSVSIISRLNPPLSVLIHIPEYTVERITPYVLLALLPLQGIGFGLCNIISIEHRLFIAGVLALSVLLSVLFFQFFTTFFVKVFSHKSADLTEYLISILQGIPQAVYSICSIAIVGYVYLINRVFVFRQYNLSLRYKYIYSLTAQSIAKIAFKTVFLMLQYALCPILMLCVQHKINLSALSFENYCMQILEMNVCYLILRLIDAIVMATSEAYCFMQVMYSHARVSDRLRFLRLLALGTTIALTVTILYPLFRFINIIIPLFIPVSYYYHSDLFSLYYNEFNIKFTTFLLGSIVYLVAKLFTVYSNINMLIDNSVVFNFLMLVYKYALVFLTVLITLQRVTSDTALMFIFLVPDIYALPLYLFRTTLVYCGNARARAYALNQRDGSK